MSKTSKDLVVKDNGLNNYTFYKSSVQLKIFSKIIVEIRKNTELENYKFYIKDIFDDFGGSKNNYTQLKSICKKMNQMIETPQDKGFNLEVLFYSVNTKEDGYITFKVNPELKPYLLQLDTAFTQYYLSNISHLKSYYSIRIYELLKQYQNKELTGWWKITLEGLKEVLKIDEKKYKLYGDFKRFVILQAQKELAEHTDIKFTFEEEKIGRAVGRITFHIQPNSVPIESKTKPIKTIKKEVEKVEQKPQNEKLYKLLKDDLKLDDKFIKEILKTYDEKMILQNVEYTLKDLQNGKIETSIGGYFRGALKFDYANQTTLFDVKKDRKKDIDKKRKEEKQKEEHQLFQLEKLKREYEENKKKSIINYIENNLDDSLVFYNEIKELNTSTFMKFKEVKEAKELIKLVSHTGDLSISNFRVEVYEKKVKDKMNFIEYAEDKGINIIEEDGEYKMILK